MFTSALVNLYTADIEAGIRFYRDLLGFTETFRTPPRELRSTSSSRSTGSCSGWAT